MDSASLYLRLFLRAEPFESAELDSLAGRMDALRLLSSNRRERYFRTHVGVAAMSFGNKVVFGARYYDKLTASQREAVGAHEFAHMLGGDYRDKRRRVVLPSLAVPLILSVGSFLAARSALVAELAFVAWFLFCFVLLSRRNAMKFREQELRCDSVAASFVEGQQLIDAIRICESMSRPRGGRRAGANAGAHPTLDQRIESIGRVTERTSGDEPGLPDGNASTEE
jgi:Zn-dependent protease with chaperone function